MTWLNRLFFVLNCALAIWFAHFLFQHTSPPSSGGWEYKDVISVILSAVTVVLAALAILLALAAVWGYQKLADHAAERASNMATSASQNYLNSDAFFGRVSTICAEFIRANMQADLASRVDVDEQARPQMPNNEAGNQDRAWED